jgi:hypothetical protein
MRGPRFQKTASRRPSVRAEMVRRVLRQQLLARRAAIDAALQELAAYKFGPGHGHGLREYWRKRHESEQAGRGAINSR